MSVLGAPTQAARDARGARREALAVAALTCAVVAFMAVVVVKSASGTLLGPGDTNQYSYAVDYVARHLRFAPWPTIDLENDDTFYPYGTVQALQPWQLERDLSGAALLRAFGAGPWLQLYFLASIAITLAGTHAALRRDFGPVRAALAGVAATVGAYYTIHKYPTHYPLAVVHWTTLSVAVDFVLVHRAARAARISLGLVLARAALLFLALGQELGYVAGFALTSFSVSVPFVVGAALQRARRDGLSARGALRRWASSCRGEVRERPAVLAALALAALLAAMIYVPLAACVVAASRRLDLGGASGVFWVNQLRLFIPFLPGVHPDSTLVRSMFGDAEGVGEDSPGLWLMIVAAIGVAQAARRRELAAYAPLLVFLFLSVAYHPRAFPTLRVFPWFAFNRVAGRATLVLPIGLSLCGLAIRVDLGRRATRRWIAAVFALALAETATAYALKSSYEPFVPDASFDAFMTAVRDAPGEAVLDWPFCAAGGNGVGTERLCPYYGRNATIYAYEQFHRKKVVGQYFSRLAPSQIAPYLDAGWDRLFAPDAADPHVARRETRCFGDREWRLFDAAFTASPFAGIDLYPDLLAPGCAARFHERYGPPAATTTLPGVGPVEFIPRPRGAPLPARADRALRLFAP